MGVDYYGVLYEDEMHLIVVELNRYDTFWDEFDEAAKLLIQLFEEMDEHIRRLHEAENVTSYEAMTSLLRIANVMEKVHTDAIKTLAYFLLMRALGKEPRVLDEFQLDEIARKKRVCVISGLRDDCWYRP